MGVKWPLKEINLAEINSSACTIHEALKADFYLEHVNNKEDHATKFFDSRNTSSEAQAPAVQQAIVAWNHRT